MDTRWAWIFQLSVSTNKQVEKEREKQAIIDRKRAEQAKKEELVDLFKPIQVQQKVPFGVNPKTILCAFHKAGTCTKGDKCKFSHDINIERKTMKRDLYTDNRDDEKKNGKVHGVIGVVAPKTSLDATCASKSVCPDDPFFPLT